MLSRDGKTVATRAGGMANMSEWLGLIMAEAFHCATFFDQNSIFTPDKPA